MTTKPPFDRSAATKAQWALQRAFLAQHTLVPQLLEPAPAPAPLRIQIDDAALKRLQLALDTDKELVERLNRHYGLKRQPDHVPSSWSNVIPSETNPARTPKPTMGSRFENWCTSEFVRFYMWISRRVASGTKPTTTKKANPWTLKEAPNDQR